MANKKKKVKKWTKFHHRVVWFTLKPFFVLYFKLRYKFHRQRLKKGEYPSPAIIMCNHYTTMDPFMVGSSFPKPIYFIASEDLFTIPVVSPIIKYLVNPIPKTKSKSDLSTIRNSLKILGEGYPVAIFPEGNRSLSGACWHIDESTAKLVKLAKVPLIFYHIKGGYGADPRWGKKLRKGKTYGYIKKIIPYEELKDLSGDEIYNIIVENVVSNDYELDLTFKSKTRAEYLERALYYCPICNSFNSLHSEKEFLLCKNCHLQVEYTENLRFKNLNDDFMYGEVKSWYDEQKPALTRKVETLSSDEVIFSDYSVTTRKIVNKKRKKLGKADLLATKNGLTLILNGKTIDIPFEKIDGATVLGKRKINFYFDEQTLQIKGFKRFNSIKYLDLFEICKK